MWTIRCIGITLNKMVSLGFITAGYLPLEKKRPTDDEIMETLDDTGIRVVGYVSQVIQKEKKPWYETIFSLSS